MSINILNWTVDEVKQAFDNAERTGNLEKFSDWFWTEVSRAQSKPSAQSILKRLEEYKRLLGRHYDKFHKLETLIKYNNVEAEIRYLQSVTFAQRTSKPYKLDLPDWVNQGR